MYPDSNDRRTADRGAARTSLPIIAAFTCGGIILLALASTIVLALIPIYLPDRSVASDSLTSNEFTVYGNIDSTGGTSKRDATLVTDPGNLIGATVTDSSSVSSLKTLLKSMLASLSAVSDITDPSCQILIPASSGRRRRGLQNRRGITYVLGCTIRVIFKFKMPDKEKNIVGIAVQGAFQAGYQPGKFTYPMLIFSFNGGSYKFRPKHTGFQGVSFIGAPGGGNDLKNTLATIATTRAPTGGISG